MSSEQCSVVESLVRRSGRAGRHGETERLPIESCHAEWGEGEGGSPYQSQAEGWDTGWARNMPFNYSQRLRVMGLLGLLGVTLEKSEVAASYTDNPSPASCSSRMWEDCSNPLNIQSVNQSNTRVAHLVACISNLVDIHICKFAVISFGLRWFEDMTLHQSGQRVL